MERLLDPDCVRAIPRRIRSRTPLGVVSLRDERWVLVCCLTAAMFLTGWNLGGGPRYSQDEGTYTAQAWSVFDFRISPYSYTFEHPPLAWIQMAPFLRIFAALGLGDSAVECARYLSLLTIAIVTALMYVISRRLMMPRAVAVSAVLLMLFSPLTQDYMRRVSIDGVALCWLLLAFAVALAPGRHRWNYGLAGMAFSVAVLNKETMLLSAPALVVAVFTYARREQSWTSAGASVLGMVLVGLGYPLWALTEGHLGRLIRAVPGQFLSGPTSGSVFSNGTGRHTVVERWLSLDSRLICVGLCAAVVLLLVRRFSWLGMATLLPLSQILRPGGYLPSILALMMLPFLALSTAAVLSLAWQRFGDSWAAQQLACFPRTATTVVACLCLPIAVARLSAPPYRGNMNTAADQAVHWLENNTARNTRILVDDEAFAELRRNGRTDPWGQAVYAYELDLDPMAKREIPYGRRDIQYVLDTPLMRDILRDSRLVEANRILSTPVATFGQRDSQVMVRKVISG